MSFYGCWNLININIPNSIVFIGDEAFAYCTSLTSVIIPESVTSIGQAAFAGCTSLYEFKGKFATEDGKCLVIDNTLISFASAGVIEYTIGNSITKIGLRAFDSSLSLKSITIPDSVDLIRPNAFEDCSSLVVVYCKATTPPIGNEYMFRFNASDRKIYVPMESVEAYKSALYWSNYADAIVGYNF